VSLYRHIFHLPTACDVDQNNTMGSTLQEKQHDDVEKLAIISSDGDAIAPKSPEEKALVRKIDLYLMPSIWFLYLLAVCYSLRKSKSN
jgi:hypothetical protein